jgi:ATP-binding cassette, subfamily B, multidrug efflux pump
MFTAKNTPAERIPIGLWAQFLRQSPGYLVGLALLAGYNYLQYRFDVQLDQAVKVAVGNLPGNAKVLGLLLAGIAVFSFFVRVVSRVAIFNGGRNAEYELRRALLHHLHKLGPAFYSRMSTGDIMSRVTNDLAQVRLLLGFGVLTFFSTLFALISSLAVTLQRSVKLTLASLAMLPLLLIVVWVFSRAMYGLQRDNQDALGKLSGRVQASIAGVRVVRSFGLEASELQQFDRVNNEYLTKALRLARVRGFMWPVMEGISSVGLVVLLWYGGHLVLTDPSFDAGSFVSFFRALSRLTWPLISLGFMISVIQRGRASYARIREVFDTQPDIVSGTTRLPDTGTPPHLALRNLRFSYGSHTVLDGVSFELPPSRSLAIVGRTGSGKSTLALLLSRLQPTPRGSIFLNDVDICDLPLDELRGAIGYAQQDPFLFSTTVGRNMGYSLDTPDTDVAQARIEAAAAEAQIDQEVRGLPDSYDTVVGERGVQLSGGQKQRTALARALVREPRILVLDDPLSAVDSRTETAILAALDKQRGQRSVILITHRVSAARRCDTVLVLDAGKVVGYGTHDELVAQGGLYAAFAEEQRIESELQQLSAEEFVAQRAIA